MPTFDDLLADEFSGAATAPAPASPSVVAPPKKAPTFDDLLGEEFGAPPAPVDAPIQGTLGAPESLAPAPQQSLLDVRTAANAQRPSMQGQNTRAATQAEMDRAPQDQADIEQKTQEQIVQMAVDGVHNGTARPYDAGTGQYEGIPAKYKELYENAALEASGRQHVAQLANQGETVQREAMKQTVGDMGIVGSKLAETGLNLASTATRATDALGITKGASKTYNDLSGEVGQGVSEVAHEQGTAGWIKEKIGSVAGAFAEGAVGGVPTFIADSMNSTDHRITQFNKENPTKTISGAKRALAVTFQGAVAGITGHLVSGAVGKVGLSGPEILGTGTVNVLEQTLAPEMVKKILSSAVQELPVFYAQKVLGAVGEQLAGMRDKKLTVKDFISMAGEAGVDSLLFSASGAAVEKAQSAPSELRDYFKKNPDAAKAFVERNGSRTGVKEAGFQGRSTVEERQTVLEELKAAPAAEEPPKMGFKKNVEAPAEEPVKTGFKKNRDARRAELEAGMQGPAAATPTLEDLRALDQRTANDYGKQGALFGDESDLRQVETREAARARAEQAVAPEAKPGDATGTMFSDERLKGVETMADKLGRTPNAAEVADKFGVNREGAKALIDDYSRLHPELAKAEPLKPADAAAELGNKSKRVEAERQYEAEHSARVQRIEAMPDAEIREQAKALGVTSPGSIKVLRERVKQVEIRRNEEQRKRVAEMSPEEKDKALLTHELTGIPNKRAYEEAPKKKFQVQMDVEGLKYFNDHVGKAHNLGDLAGDEVLKKAAGLLHKVLPEVYNTHGDTFISQADTAEEAHAMREKLQPHLDNEIVDIRLPDGTVKSYKGLGISLGVGENLESAHGDMENEKLRREASGERAPRGDKPRSLVESTEGQRDSVRTDAVAGEPAKKRGFRKSVPTEAPRVEETPVKRGLKKRVAEEAPAESTNERGKTQYNLKDAAAPSVKRADVERVFPGADVTDTADGHRVTFKGGNYLDVHLVDKIDVDWASAEKDYGRAISKKERDSIVAAGSFELKSKDGQTLNGLGLLQLAKGAADSSTLLHESLHFAKAMGLFSKAEWANLVEQHSEPSKPDRQQEEDVASARETWTGAVIEKVKGWAEKILEKFGIYRDVDDKNYVFELMDKAAFWKRVPTAAKAVEGAPARQKTISLNFGRPDLANKGHTAPVRELMDAVDEDRKLTHEERSRSVMREKAKGELAKDYEGEKQRLLDIGKFGGVLNEIETHMAEEILNREASEAIKSNNKARLGEAVRIMDAYRRSGTEAARAFGARGDPMETAKQRYQRNVNEAILSVPQRMYSLKGEKRTAALGEWAEKIEALKFQLKARGVDVENISSPVEAAQALGQVAAAKSDRWDAAYEYFRNSILSGIVTQTANVIGNVGHAGWSLTAERLVESSINLLAKDKNGATSGEFKHVLAGFMPGLARGARNALLSFKAEVPMLEASMGAKGQVQVEDAHVAIEGAKGRAIRVPQRLLLAADEFCKSLVAQMDVGAQAYRIAKNEGLSETKLSARMHELTENLGSEAWRGALKTAQHLAFQDENKLSKTVVKLRSEIPGLRYVIPFVTTPLNILKTGISKSPLGSLALGKKVYDNVREGRPAFTDATGKAAQQMIAWTAALALMGSNKEDDPWITGAESAGDFRKRALANRTHPPLSVKVFGNWYSYARLEPFASALGLTVDWTNGLKSNSSGKGLTAPFESLMGQLKDKTFISGLSDLLQAAFPGPGQDRKETAAKWASNFTSSWIPNIIKTGFRSTHDDLPERGVWGSGSDWWKMLGKRTLQKTELAGMVFPDEPSVDLWGNKNKRNSGPVRGTDWLYRMIVPIDKRKEDIFQGDRALLNWNNQNPDEAKFPMVPGKNYRQDGVTKYWTPEEYSKYCELSGKLAKKMVSTEIVNADKPTAQDIATLTDALKDARKEARKAMLGGTSDEIDTDVAANALVLKNEQEMLAHLASAPPLKADKREEWKEKKQEALAWVKARGMSESEARAALWKHVNKHYKDDATKQKYMERLKLNMK